MEETFHALHPRVPRGRLDANEKRGQCERVLVRRRAYFFHSGDLLAFPLNLIDAAANDELMVMSMGMTLLYTA